ncbi:MAG: Na(+)/H(+) antiporter subunit D [Deltaproteobacteria bacterium]|nr:Na(+)/H(+) antiporter subunit D [Deltaproteobacteria bacterium]
MIASVPPAVLFILGALLIPLLKGRIKSAYLLLLPLLAFLHLLRLPEGNHWIFEFMGYHLILGRVDKLSLVFGYIFVLITFIANLYALHVKDDVQHMAAFIYAGSALGVTFAGDFFSLFVFWEMLAAASTFLIWSRRTEASLRAGFRYILVHIFGGLCLLAGIILHVHETGSIEFARIGLEGGWPSYLLLIGFGLNAAIPPLHPWLVDAYPEATVTGAVYLSAFTTKSAVYLLARTFPGAEVLIWFGAFMTVIPIFYAVLENDIRRVLAYSLINQVGFMVTGVGIGTPLSINGTVSHAFSHILYKALLFMSAGSVLHMTGKIRCTDLGGLYKTMPLTALFCMIGAASISAFPLFSGFVSKSMIVTAAAREVWPLPMVWLLLQFASAGVFHHAGIKVPYFTFFSQDSGIRTQEPPFHMLLAMGLAAFLCIFLGLFPGALYALLPYPVDYIPYTAGHVMGQLQLLIFGALAFCFLILSGVYPPELRAINLDTDWFYRKGAQGFLWILNNHLSKAGRAIQRVSFEYVPSSLAGLSKNPVEVVSIVKDGLLLQFYRLLGLAGAAEVERRLSKRKAGYPAPLKSWTASNAVVWVILFLPLCLLLFYLW